MKYRALVSFSGALSMHQNEVRELNNKAIIKDLLRAKYIEEIKEEPNKEDELKEEIEKLKKELEEIKKEPIDKVEGNQKPKQEDAAVTNKKESKKDVKSVESKRNNSK